MYKVFFNDRKLHLTDDFVRNFQVRQGLFYKYKDKEDLKNIISVFDEVERLNQITVFHYDIEKLRDEFRKCFTYINAAGGVVKNSKDDILMIYRRGKWDLPKGKVDDGEEIMDAAVREVQEECGIKELTVKQPLLSTYHTYHQKDKFILKRTAWYEMYYTGNDVPTPETDEDIEKVEWVSKSNITSKLGNTYPAIQDVLKMIGVG